MPAVPDSELDVLRRWANGDFYPLSGDERGALDELADEMAKQPDRWWQAFRQLLPEADRTATQNLSMPFAALLHIGGAPMWDEVADHARRNRKVANAFWDAMDFARLKGEAYKRLGRRMTIDAFIRHEPRLAKNTLDEWEDNWSGEVLFYLDEEEPDEAWAMALELLAVKPDPRWAPTIGAFIIEDLLHDHGDAFIDRIEAEARRNEQLKRALPTTRWMVPDRLMDRVRLAAGPYWKDRRE